MAKQAGPVPGAAVRDDAPDASDYGMVTRPILAGLGPIPVVIDQPATSTVTTVPVDGIGETLLAANPARLGAMIWNDSGDRLYVKLGMGASTGNFTVRLEGYSYYELPFPAYTGAVTAIRTVVGASLVQVTELTP